MHEICKQNHIHNNVYHTEYFIKSIKENVPAHRVLLIYALHLYDNHLNVTHSACRKSQTVCGYIATQPNFINLVY